jgi:hypothetical protein
VRHGPFAREVYNFEVEGLHCYAVGPAGLLVHNTNAGEAEEPGNAGRGGYENASEGTRSRLGQEDLLEQPGMHETSTQKHHPFFRMFRDAMNDAEFNVRTSSGRMRGLDLQDLELLEHQDLHAEWNDFVDREQLHEALRVGENGRARLAEALRNGEITPHQIYKALERFYTETGNDAALRSLRRYGRRLGIDQPGLPF